MPLTHGYSRVTIGKNIREMQHAGHPHDQAVAAALRSADDAKGAHAKRRAHHKAKRSAK